MTGGTGAGSEKRRKSPRRADGRIRGDALTQADLVILSLLSESPMHGYQLNSEIDRQEVSDWAQVSKPHVYYALRKLARKRLVAKSPARGKAGGPERSCYQVTRKGSNALRTALAKEQWSTSRPPSPFTTWVGLSIHAAELDISRMIDARAAFLRQQIGKEKATLPHIRTDPGPRARVGEYLVLLCIRQFQVELAWLDELKAGMMMRDTGI